MEWQERYKTYIFLRDSLDLSAALDYNFQSRGVYTDLGLAEYNAKNAHHRPSVNALATACIRAIAVITAYKECDAICAVPPSPDKDWDLPTEIVKIVSEKTGKPDISTCIVFRAVKKNIKATSLQEKWAALEAADLVADRRVGGKKIMLLVDST
jgi:hypothetical protein